MANDSITVIETAEQYKDLIHHPGQTTIIDFWASWCAPCKAIAPRFENLAQTHTNDSLVFAKVELKTEDPDHWTNSVAQGLNISSIPHFVALRDGEQIGFKKGARVDLAGFVSEIKSSE